MADSTSSNDFLAPARQEGELGRLGPYRVLDTIGSGGMGRVFRAEDTRLKRSVALKVMNDKFAATAGSRRRFLEEARAMAAVDNDHVVRIYEVGEHNKTPFMAMELLKGRTLEELNLAGERLSPTEIIQLAQPLCRGLDAAHQRDIIHRDIKPGNIWLESPSGRPKILDFGLALAVGPMGQLAGQGSVVGTPGYLSPEQARNEPLDDRSDLYSLGVVLFELCTGKLPFQAKTVPMMLIAIITHPTPKVSSLNPEVPQPLANLIDRLLSKEARDRPATALALEAELAAAAEAMHSESHAALQIVTESEVPTSKSNGVAKSSDKAGTDAEVETAKSWFQSPLIMGGVAGSILLLCLGLGLAYVFSGGEPAGVSKPTVGVPPPPVVKKTPITKETLQPLVVQDLTAAPAEVGIGDPATLQFNLLNRAVGRDDNPARVHSRESTVAVSKLYLQPEDDVRRDGYALPLRRKPSQLPAPGRSTPLQFRFSTGSIPVGEYQAIVTLETPDGVVVNETSTPIKLVPNLGRGELLGFEIVRSWAGSGADTTVGQKAAKDAGEKKQLVIAGLASQAAAQQQHIYLRFDLTRWNTPREQLQHAVLMLTLAGDSAKSPFGLRVYVVGESLPKDWKESGEGRLVWSATPSAANLGKLHFLGTIEADNSGDVLKNQVDAVRLFGPELDDAVRQAGDAMTLVLVRSSGNNQPLRFFSKESEPEKAPALALQSRP